jgi:hypothetical protein
MSSRQAGKAGHAACACKLDVVHNVPIFSTHSNSESPVTSMPRCGIWQQCQRVVSFLGAGRFRVVPIWQCRVYCPAHAVADGHSAAANRERTLQDSDGAAASGC